MTRYDRPHNLTVFFSLTRYFWVLLLPLVRTALKFGFDFENAFAGYGADIAVISVLFGYALTRKLFCKIAITDYGISVSQGFLFRKSIAVRYKEMSCVKLWQNPFTALFGCYVLRVYTDADKKPLIKAYLKSASAAEIKKFIGFGADRLCGFRGAAAYSLISSDGRRGLLFLLAVVSAVGTGVGKGISVLAAENITLITDTVGNALKTVITGSAVVAVCALTSFLLNIFGIMGFCARFCGSYTAVSYGIFKKLRCRINGGADYAQIMNSLFFGGCSLYIGRRGFGNEKYEHSLILPYADKSAALAVMKTVTGFVPSDEKIITSGKLRRFITVPLALFWGVCFVSGMGVGAGLFGGFHIAALVLPAPFLLRVIYGVYEWQSAYIGNEGNVITASYSLRSKRFITVFGRESVSKLTLYRNPFQRARGECNMRFFLACSEKRKIAVRNLDFAQCRDFAKNNVCARDG